VFIAKPMRIHLEKKNYAHILLDNQLVKRAFSPTISHLNVPLLNTFAWCYCYFWLLPTWDKQDA